MTKHIPLSLQVFHSRNEFEAQRLNRTEQVRLRDLHDVIKREQELYVKDHALCTHKFSSHYPRRRSEPGISSTNVMSCRRGNSKSNSISSRASLTSAPGKLQSVEHVTSSEGVSSLASRMYSSMGEISTMTRFQRIQRKFSIASFTDHGLLTATGSRMAKNIDRARKVLFKNGHRIKRGKVVLPKINKQNASKMLESIKDDDGQELNNSQPEEGESRERSNGRCHDHVADKAFRRENCTVKTMSHKERETPHRQNMSQRENRGVQENVTARPQSSASQYEDQNKQTPSLHVKEGNPRRQSVPQNKKRVKIQWSNISDSSRTFVEETTTDIHTASTDLLGRQTLQEPSRDFTEWRSILSRKVKNLDSLQQKINLFLADQSDFNRVFPKNFDGRVQKMSSTHKELANIGREKREQQKTERKKKKEIVLEVLGRLGIEDETILSTYQEC